MLELYTHAAILVFLFMNILFNIALYKKDNSIVDIGWGAGFIMIALYCINQSIICAFNQILVTVLVLIWGIRISTHILIKNWGKQEDPRYAAWRKQWTWVKVRSYFQVFMLQGLIMLIIAYPIIFINNNPSNTVDLHTLFGIALWIFGFIFESVGDYQLKLFLEQPKNKGKIMQSGLWRYTRHPNYFGESIMWWGIALLCFGLPMGWTAIISPLLLTYLLLFVSGVPMAERTFKGNKEFEKYKKKTNVFIPWLTLLLLNVTATQAKKPEIPLEYYAQRERTQVQDYINEYNDFTSGHLDSEEQIERLEDLAEDVKKMFRAHTEYARTTSKQLYNTIESKIQKLQTDLKRSSL